MPLHYQVTSNGYHFGLTYQGVEVLPCINNKLWRITPDLIGFRQDNLFGIYSMPESRVLYEPALCAEVPCFRQVSDGKGALVTRPRFISSHPGTFMKGRAYLETCDYLFWQRNRLFVLSPSGIVVITRSGEIREYKGKKPEEVACRIRQRCLFEEEYACLTKSELTAFDYLTEADRELEEENFLNGLFLQGMEQDLDSLLGSSVVNSDVPEPGEPAYKHYDYEGIPPLIKEKLIGHLSRFFDTSSNERLARLLIYLAWCHANGFVREDQKGNRTIDPWYASLPADADSAESLDSLYEAHQLQPLQHLLYVSAITNSYLDLQALLN
ncbi:hypothetical protein [Rufibacter tibetensis]|uniref:Uncharacterized protein n=1 Tax=Rufibacter tibetensis TaxID=512763 RepID=A0A0P0CSE7_9BACT|nr:hypothetical protein [Rufibacter tibetensis]ALI98098.1 hypothetical protein DC20_02780 [Rufibacter tibetensis]